MNAIAMDREYSAEDLLWIPDSHRYELVDGTIKERNMGAVSGWIGSEIYAVIRQFCRENNIGWVFCADVGFQCYPSRPRLVRYPDVAMVRFGRLPNEELPDSYIQLVPDLVAEVISPNDLAYEVDTKVEEYLQVGVPLVWVVYPDTRTINIFRPDGSAQRLRADQELQGESVLPGFCFPVGELFPPRRTHPVDPAS